MFSQELSFVPQGPKSHGSFLYKPKEVAHVADTSKSFY